MSPPQTRQMIVIERVEPGVLAESTRTFGQGGKELAETCRCLAEVPTSLEKSDFLRSQSWIEAQLGLGSVVLLPEKPVSIVWCLDECGPTKLLALVPHWTSSQGHLQ